MGKMVQKAEKEMMQIFHHGNKNQGYSILESTIAVFISSLLLLAVLGLIKTFQSTSMSINNYVVSHIEMQNQKANDFTKN